MSGLNNYRSNRRRGSRRRAAAVIVSCAVAMSASAQSGDEEAIEEIVVQGTPSRIPSDLSSVPGSITVVGAEELQRQSLFSNDLGEILERTVPGFGVSSSASFSNFSQTLRGRKPAVFIDGIPTTVPLRDGGRDLRVISPGAVGQVEVIRGATSVYGLGGAGGLINYATRLPGDGPAEFRTDVSAGVSLTHPSDSTNYTLQQSALGRADRLSYVFSGFYETYNSLFDAQSDRIPPDPQGQGGIADSDSFNLFGKLGLDLSDEQSVFLTLNYYETEQDTDFSNGVGEFGSRPSPAVAVPPLGEDQSTENLVAALRYEHRELFGGRFNVQAFFSDYEAVFGFFEPPVFPPDGGQSLIDAERYGLRIDGESTLADGRLNLLWGVDYVEDETSQPMTDGRLLVPVMEQESIAPFIQAELAAGDMVKLVGGIRQEDAEISVGTFTTIPIFDPFLPGGVTIRGGSVDYDETLFNVGLVFTPFGDSAGPVNGIDIYAGFSQGFTVNDFGRALRSTTVDTISDFNFEAQVIDSYEIGARGDFGATRASFAAFRSESDFGSSFNAVTLELLRAPEEIWGVEATLDAEPTEDWRFGASVSWVDGTVENGGVESNLDTSRIPPLKFVSYAEYDATDDWSLRGQITYSARQARFDDQQVFGRADVEAYALVDVLARGRVGPGRLSIAINNLLNEYYFTPDAFRFANDAQFTAGVGMTARVTYSIEY